MIIDHLWYDKPSLSRCCQVARCWTQSSRFHLFRQISIYVAGLSPERLHDFIDLLNPSKQIGHHIRCLALHEYIGHWRRAKTFLDIGVVEAILAKLPNLSRLSLTGIFLTLLNTSGTKNPCPCSLQYLSISHVDIFGQLSSVLNCFARVDNLELIHIDAGRIQKPATEVEEEVDDVRDALVRPTMPPRCLGIRCLKLRLERQAQKHPIDEGVELASLTELNVLFSAPAYQ